jgi:hypothetical protein
MVVTTKSGFGSPQAGQFGMVATLSCGSGRANAEGAFAMPIRPWQPNGGENRPARARLQLHPPVCYSLGRGGKRGPGSNASPQAARLGCFRWREPDCPARGRSRRATETDRAMVRVLTRAPYVVGLARIAKSDPSKGTAVGATLARPAIGVRIRRSNRYRTADIRRSVPW